jgi:hypothetical protein
MKEMGKLGVFETQVKYNHPYHQNMKWLMINNRQAYYVA